MLRKGLALAGGTVLLLTLFFGRDLVSYTKTSLGWVHTAVKDSVPIPFELERARKMIKDLDPEISRHKREIAKEELALQKLAEQLQADDAQLAKNWSDIERLKRDLAEGDSKFVYAGHSYTAKQVETDLSNRFDRYQTKEATVEKVRKILEIRQKGLTAAQDKLKAMVAAKRQLEVEVENLEARLKMVEVAKASSDFNIDDSQLSRTRELLKDIETRIEVDAQLVHADDLVLDEIKLEEPATSASILDRISQYEQQKGTSPSARLAATPK
jgi:membrane-associated HD superfamily phosphohydrolase